jgi:hypothetical protein
MIDKIMDGFKKSDDQMVYLFDNDMKFEIGESVITENMFFIGSQDIEDSVDSVCWVEALNAKYEGNLEFSTVEIDALKIDILKNQKIAANKKFYRKLEVHISNKWIEAGKDIDELEKIPSKGKESSDFLMTGITGVDRIPEKIKMAFDKLGSV